MREDAPPGECLDEVCGPERHQHGDNEHTAHRRLRDLCHVEGDREREQDVRDRDKSRDHHRPARDRAVDRLGDDVLVVVERERLLDLAAQLTQRPEGRDEQNGKRAEVAHDEPAHGAGQESSRLKAGTAVEEAGERFARRPLLYGSGFDQPFTSFQPWTQSSYVLQTSPRSSPQSETGVFQNSIWSKNSSSSAW